MDEPPIQTENAQTENARESRPAPDFSAATQPSYMRTLFFGDDGLRPGWGLVCYLVLYFALRQLSERLAYSDFIGARVLFQSLADECGLFLAAVIPAIVLARIERRPWPAYGLPIRPLRANRLWRSQFPAGIFWGFAAISLLMIALYGLHAFSFGHVVLHGMRILKFASYWAAMFLAVGLFEEFFFRGYTQFTLARGIGFWPAALTLSMVFGLIHLGNPGEHWQGALAAAVIGLFFCFTLRRTGNLWFAVGFHAAWDWGETFFYSVPDSGMKSPGHLLSSSLRGSAWLSGGSVGPEGSVLCFVVIGVVCACFAAAYKANSCESR